MSKVYSVTVLLEFNMPVLADSAEEAEKIACKHWREEGYLYPDFSVNEIKTLEDLKKYAEFDKYCYPWKKDIFYGENDKNIEHFILKNNEEVMPNTVRSSSTIPTKENF